MNDHDIILKNDPQHCMWRPCMHMDCAEFGPKDCLHRDILLEREGMPTRTTRDRKLVDSLIAIFDRNAPIDDQDLTDALALILGEHRNDYGIDVESIFSDFGFPPVRRNTG